MDKAFINKVQQIILNHIEDEKLNVNTLSFEIGLSRSQIWRKVKALTGMTVNQFICEVRLKEAVKLIQKDEFTAAEIAYKVGFNSPSYFHKCFHDHFGVTPGEYKEQNKNINNDQSENKDSQQFLNNFFKIFYQKNKHKRSIRPSVIYSLLLLILIAIIAFLFKDKFLIDPSSTSNTEVQYFNIVLPENAPISFNTSQTVTGQTAFDISPDGTKIVYVTEQKGKLLLAIRSLDEKDIYILSGTEGAYSPFFSPNGLWIGFFTYSNTKGSLLKKISITTKVTIDLCSVSNPFGGDWNTKGNIIFGDNMGTKLKIVSENGGSAKLLELFIEGNKFTNRIMFPKFLKDGNHIIISGNPITIFSIKTGKGKTLNQSGFNVHYLNSGHLTFAKNSKLMVCSFNLKNFKITGNPFPMFQDIRTEIFNNAGQFTVSDNGDLIFVDNMPTQLVKFMWIKRDGKVLDTLQLPPANYGMFSLSSSGDLLAFSLSKEIWVYNLINKKKIKIPDSNEDGYPFFNSKDISVAFNRGSGLKRKISIYSIDRNKIIDVLNMMERGDLSDWSPNDRYLGFQFNDNLFVYMFENDTVLPLLQEDYAERQITFSPNSKFFTYVSDEKGQLEIYVQPFPTNGKKWNISQGFGFDPIWSFDGKEIYYRNNNQLYAVKVNTDSIFKHKNPELLFEGDFVDVSMKSFAVSPNNKKILVLKPLNKINTTRELTIIHNWFEDLKNKIPHDD